MRHFRGWSSSNSLGLIALTLGVLVLAAPFARSQGRAADAERLNPAKLEDHDRRILEDLFKGKVEVGETQKKLLDKAAQWFVYRLTHSEYHFKSNPDSGDQTNMKILVEDAIKHIVVADPKKPMSDNQRQYMKAFADAMVVHIKKVLVHPVPIVRVNAAIILAHLGNSGLDEMAGPLCDVVDGKEYDDPVKLYALIGLKNLFKALAYQDDTDKTVIRFRRLKPVKPDNPSDEERCIQVLLQFLARKPTYGPNASPEEVEAFRYIRREAIRALGWIHVPMVAEGTTIKAMPALDLARIAVNPDSLTPKASLSEQLEAAIALCKLQNKLAPERKPYQQDYAAYLVAHTVVDFVTRAEAERSNPASTMDWKYSAYRLNEALGELRQDGFRSDYIKKMVELASTLLENVHKGEGVGQLTRLSGWLEQRKPAVMELFKGLENTAIKPAEPAAEK